MTGAALIAEERQRQIEVEGYTLEHDAAHWESLDLVRAAVVYALPEPLRGKHFSLWPWDEEYWKPTPNDRVRELVKAGALIAAEIDRINAAKGQGESR